MAANTERLSAVLVSVADDGIVVELIVKPATLAYVVPDAMVVLPKVGAVYTVVVAICTQAEPDQAYIALVVEFQYVAPVMSAPPKLSTVGAVALEPR